MRHTLRAQNNPPSARRWSHLTRAVFIAFAAWGVQAGCGSDDPNIADPCEQGDVQQRACEGGGKQSRTCDAAGVWGAFSACPTPDELCDEGQTGTRTCGLNNAGEQALHCVDSTWEPNGACVDPDTCTSGDSRQADCEDGDFGSRAQTCNSGQWESSECVGNSIALSANFGCAVRNSGHVLCWGDNFYGQLGVNHKNVVTQPTHVKLLEDAKQVVTTSRSACALTTAGDVYCWGSPQHGVLGNNNATDEKLTPNKVPTLSGVVQLTSGSDHVCALLNDATVSCWGRNDFAQTGVGNTEPQHVPAAALHLTDIGAVEAGWNRTCARKRRAPNISAIQPTDTYCWGANEGRAAGILNSDDIVLSPTKIAGQAFSDSATAGDAFCGVSVDVETVPVLAAVQTLRCVGPRGPEHGDGSGALSYTAFHTAALSYSGSLTDASIDIRAFGDRDDANMCALMPGDNQLHCWGHNTSASLGRGHSGTGTSGTTAQIATPYPLNYFVPFYSDGIIVTYIESLAEGIREFAVGSTSICAITSSGAIDCTGAFASDPYRRLSPLAGVPPAP